MKNKIISIVLCLVILLSFAACSNSKKDTTESTTDAPETTTEATTKMVDESLIDVEFTLPASFFSEDDPATEELSDKQKKQGIKKAVVNEAGSVTYTLSKKAFKELKKSMYEEISKQLNAINKDYPCVKKVEFNKDFSKIDLYVNAEEYEGLMNAFAVYTAGLYGQMYQAYSGTDSDKLSVDVNVINVDTNEKIEDAHYPVKES